MSAVKWIKITTDVFDDEKIKLIDALPDADAILVIWFKLLAQAGKSNQQGALLLNHKLAYTEEMLSTIFNRKLLTVRLALQTFEELGMIERGEYIQITNWEKHQNIEGMEKIRLQNAERQRKYRERQKQLQLEQKESNATATLHNAVDKDIEEDKELDNKKEIIKEKPSSVKKTYGEFDNVKLTDDEFAKLLERGIDRSDYIERLSQYVESSGKKYKSHYAVILSWHRRDAAQEKPKKKQPLKPEVKEAIKKGVVFIGDDD